MRHHVTAGRLVFECPCGPIKNGIFFKKVEWQTWNHFYVLHASEVTPVRYRDDNDDDVSTEGESGSSLLWNGCE